MEKPAVLDAALTDNIMERKISEREPAILCLALALFVAGCFLLGFTTGIDDAHITYFAANMLARHGEILNYNLERVEQSSSLLHVVSTALLVRLTSANPVTVGHLLPLLAAILCIFAVFSISRKNSISVASSIICASSINLVYWSQGGLEASISALLLLVYVHLLTTYNSKETNAPPLMAAGVALQATRPEMVVFVPTFTLFVAIFHRFINPKNVSFLRGMQASLIGISIAALLVLWRLSYFGDWMPQPVSAKSSGFSMAALQQGMGYFTQNFRSLPGALKALVSVVACTFALWCFYKNRTQTLMANAAIACMGYATTIVLMGGDWMPEGRLWVSIIPILSLLIAFMLNAIPGSTIRWTVILAAVLANFYYLHGMGQKNTFILEKTKPHPGLNLSIFEERSIDNSFNISTLAFIKNFISKNPEIKHINILSGQMGFVAYHLASNNPGLLHFTDRNGLVERSITLCEATRQRARTAYGVEGLVTLFFIKNTIKLQELCGIQKPDIIFDLWMDEITENTTILMEKNGYERIHLDKGIATPYNQMILASKDFLTNIEKK